MILKMTRATKMILKMTRVTKMILKMIRSIKMILKMTRATKMIPTPIRFSKVIVVTRDSPNSSSSIITLHHHHPSSSSFAHNLKMDEVSELGLDDTDDVSVRHLVTPERLQFIGSALQLDSKRNRRASVKDSITSPNQDMLIISRDGEETKHSRNIEAINNQLFECYFCVLSAVELQYFNMNLYSCINIGFIRKARSNQESHPRSHEGKQANKSRS